MSKDTDAIETLRKDYIAANSPGDLDRFMATVTDDVVYMPPDHPALVGAKAIRAWVRDNFITTVTMKLDWVFDEVQVNGNWAFVRGPFGLDLVSKSDGSKVHIKGKHLNVFQKQADGSWKIHRACFNNDQPVKQWT